MTFEANQRCAINYLIELKKSTKGYGANWLDLAIKALEQQPSDDCISREATIIKVNELIAQYIPLMPLGWTLPTHLVITINNLPSVTPTIPKMEQVEDCVARSEALDILDDFEEDVENGKFKTAYAKARERMCELPSVIPQPKIGRWVEMPLIEAGQTYSHECSLCGRKILITDAGLSEFPYCHCGAKMEVEE